MIDVGSARIINEYIEKMPKIVLIEEYIEATYEALLGYLKTSTIEIKSI